MKRVLVMGGSYFIGKKIVDVFLKGNYDVTILNRGSKPCDHPEIVNLISDRNDKTQMEETLKLKAFDYVVDVCGLNRNQMEVLCGALDMTNLKKFIFMSSSAVYDIDHLETPYHENDSLKENSVWTFYGRNKIEAEGYLEEYFKNTKTHFIAIRPPYVYGEENYAQRESFIFDHIENERPILVPNNGESKIQLINSIDLAEIVIKLVSTETEENMRLNVGNKEAMNFLEWIASCEKVVGKKAKIIKFDYKSHNKKDRDFFPFFDYDNVLDTSQIRVFYDKEVDFLDGLSACYDWYLKNQDMISFKASVKDNEDDIYKLIGYID
ncbi:NAD-dependent epimerase/dehydratase family protein [Acidaminobacter sp. JC074]|uniref:NAD-dependent epimerase/dehydratase family protein n=1 Tax=Acidaminobacter sp. JC074 TaxID=2530199 RepID=UPI001F0D7C36|nr:NAD-dependent epimerase/dehydratase family protein [Acidaminobacter sp. JC074]MCH4887113.1 NAD-dependent epimerase/dehydratase family protein [Acidaminobacter sp. JC074]